MGNGKARYTACPRCQANGKDRAGDNLVEFPDGGKHCFSCGYHEGTKRINQQLIKKDTYASNVLPVDFTREVPSSAYIWLLQFGLPWSYWKDYTGYSEKEMRLVLTVGDPIVASIGRFVGQGDAKKWKTWGSPHRSPIALGDSDSKHIVLVEDLVSAHKIAQAGNFVVPLFGTTPCKEQLQFLIECNKPLVLWLDNDQKLYRLSKTLRLNLATGLNVTSIFTDKDPKYLSFEEINEVIPS